MLRQSGPSAPAVARAGPSGRLASGRVWRLTWHSGNLGLCVNFELENVEQTE